MDYRIKSKELKMLSREIKTEVKMEPGTMHSSEYQFSCEKNGKQFTQNDKSVELDSDLQEEFHAVMEKIKYEDRNRIVESVPKILSEKRILKAEKNLDFYKTSICRLCANLGNSMIHMFGPNKLVQARIIKQIQHCLPITVKETDNLSKKVCRSCLEKLESCYEFYTTVAEAEKQQEQLILQSAVTHSNEITSEKEFLGGKISERYYYETFPQCDEGQLLYNVTEFNNETLAISKELRKADTNVETNTISSSLKLYSENLLSFDENTDYTNKKSCLDNEYQSYNAVVDSSDHGIYLSPPKSAMNEINSEKIMKLVKKACDFPLAMEIPDHISIRERSKSSEKRVIEYEDNKDKNGHNDDVISCTEVLFNEETLAEEKNVGDKRIIRCRICGENIPTFEEFRTHCSIHASISYYPCCLCDKIFANEQVWHEHIPKHFRETKNLRNRTAGITTHQSLKEYGKNIVKESIVKLRRIDETDMKAARERCSEKCDERVDRDQCSQQLVPTIHKRRYIKESSDNLCPNEFKVPVPEPEGIRKRRRARFECISCEKRFRSNGLLEDHEKHYCKERPMENKFKCFHCDKKFVHKASLLVHLRNHTGERPYTCDLCGKTFKSEATKNYHRKAHTGERIYKCNICAKTFAWSASLTRHASVHSEEKPYKCPSCPQTFKSTGARNVHKRLHSDTRPYECDLCGNSYSRKDSMLRHKKKCMRS